MKKLGKVMLLASAATMLFYGIAISGTIGNPTATLGEGKASVGLDLDFAKRKVKDSSGSSDAKTERYLLNGSYGLGMANAYLKLGSVTTKPDISGVSVSDGSAMGYGVGVKATVHEIPKKVKYGVGIQLLTFSTKHTVSGVSGDYTIDWMEYDIFAGGSYLPLGELVPYGGLVLSKVDGKTKGPGVSQSFNEDSSFGIFLGGDFKINDQLKAGAELRLVNETSFALSVGYMF